MALIFPCFGRRLTAPARFVVAAAGILLLILFLNCQSQSLDSLLPIGTELFPIEERQIEVWRKLYPIIEANAPNCDSPESTGVSGAIGFNATKAKPRPDLLFMPSQDVRMMRQAHATFIEQIQDLKTVYNHGTRGVVVTAGGPYLPVLVLSLRMLRRTGSKLPVEVFLADENEYEKSICDEVLPSMNARCVVMSKILASVTTSAEITHFQFKIFAILFSSFEDILFLDADAFPIHKPDLLFQVEPFQSYGMITWPDFWISTASPLYYEIAAQQMPSTALRASSETGEILVSKKNHHKSLLLAAYYNYYGPSHFSRLLSQGGPGEGDKETFIAAAAAVKEPFYTVSEGVRPIGNLIKEDGRLAGSAMVQFDPEEDYKLRGKGSDSIKQARPFFIHANFPKFNPATIFDWDGEIQPVHDQEGNPSRAWTKNADVIGAFGYDVEKVFWEEVKWLSCDMKQSFASWQDLFGICDKAKTYWDAVFENHEHSFDSLLES